MATILVIDDTDSVRTEMERILCDAGHKVIACSGGKRGVLFLREGHIDLVITDIYMPEGDGIEFLQQARQFSPSIKLIAMSGRPPEENQLSVAGALGATGLLEKPFSTKQLLEAVGASLQEPLHGVKSKR